jgi:hypothetical protein
MLHPRNKSEEKAKYAEELNTLVAIYVEIKGKIIRDEEASCKVEGVTGRFEVATGAR